jgi:hypothetical protein
VGLPSDIALMHPTNNVSSGLASIYGKTGETV